MNLDNEEQVTASTILVIDDSQENRVVLCSGLEAYGYDVLVATDGNEGIERARLTEPDLILLDIMLPGNDGFEVIRELKSNSKTRNIPIVFMTSLTQSEEKVKAFDSGAVDFITKPVQLSEVNARVSTHIRLSSLTEQLTKKNKKLRQEIEVRNQIEKSLCKYQELLSEAEGLAKLGSWELDLSTNELIWSEEIFRIFEIDSGKFEATYEGFLNAIHPDDRDMVNQAYKNSLENKAPYSIEHRLLMKDGRIKYVSEHGNTHYDNDGVPLYSIGTVQDITENKRAKDVLFQQEQELRELLENSPDTIARFDGQCRHKYANPAYVKLAGVSLENIIGATPKEYFLDTLQAEMFQYKLMEVFEKGVEDQFELSVLSDDIKVVNSFRIEPEVNAQGDVVSVLAVGRDVTQIERYRQKINELAFYDSLTGLPNRTLFHERLKQEIINSKRHGYLTCLMLLDLDHFKVVNDTLGHPAGDQLLKDISTRLKNVVRDYDTVARLGGDEFAILLPEIRHQYDAITIANKIMENFSSPFQINSRDLFVTPCIGVSLFPQDCEDSNELFKNADSALYAAKDQGRNCYRLYNQEMTAQVNERFELEASLRKAIQNDELELYFQPQYDISNGHLVGVEALLRWRHPEYGVLAPDKFIGIAEETGLIVSIGEWVLREACATIEKWNRDRKKKVTIAVNVSTRQFHFNDFADTVRSILNETACKPEWLELEITESLLLADRDEIHHDLEELCNSGINIAIDDFGTGYSALSYINRFPIGIIKIDRSFIHDIEHEQNSANLVKAIIAMADSLKLRLVAEGIETEQQDELLRRWGCHTAQGYLYGRPSPYTEFDKLIDRAL